MPGDSGSATLRTSDGMEHVLMPGDLIGRLWSAAVYIPDPRVSECHGALSIVDGVPTLVGLRGRFRVDGHVLRDVALVAGTVLFLAPGVSVAVVSVTMPTEELELQVGDAPPRPVRRVTTLAGRPPVWLDSPIETATGTTVWPSGSTWMRTSNEGPVPVVNGSSWSAGGVSIRAAVVGANANPCARRAEVSHHVEVDGSRVRLRVDADTVVFRGRQARLLIELIAIRQPVYWWEVARILWGEGSEVELRPRWDMLLSRVRARIGSIGGNKGLVHSDGGGLIQLLLAGTDRVSDIR